MDDYVDLKIEEYREMLSHELRGLREYAQKTNAALKKIKQIEKKLKNNDGEYLGILKFYSKELDEIFEIVKEFKT